jgi:Fe-S-cluster containining protein
MNIRETVFNLQKVFDEMTDAFSAFQSETKLFCPPGCGKCCIHPDIESTVLESLPTALKIYREGKLDQWMEKLENSGSRCVHWEGNFETGMGKCTSYETRPSVCRMFGVSGTFDKNHRVTLSVCRELRKQFPEGVKSVSAESTTENTPMIPHWYARIQHLGSPEIMVRRPINQALLEALQLVGFHSQYHENC